MKKMVFSFCVFLLLGIYGLVKLDFHPFVSSNQPGLITLVYNDTVYEIEIERFARLGDAINKIELGDDVDFNQINESLILKNGDKYIVPIKTELPCISINTADEETLIQLTGVGPAIAKRIIEYRETYGLFQSIEDIMEVKGIGEKTFEKMRDQLCI